LVGNTLSTNEKSRKCWRMIGGILVEKTVEEVVKELNTQIVNVIYSNKLL